MALAEIQKALTGGYYAATGMYSFEFRQSSGKPITEIFFLLPPTAVNVTEPQNSSLTKTLTGGYLVDYGNNFKSINISGSTHFYYAGIEGAAASEYGRSNNLGLPGYIDGYTEFVKIRFMLSRHRDYTLTNDNKLKSPSLPKTLNTTRKLREFILNQLDKGQGALAKDMVILFHDYDYDEHYYVRVGEVSFDRSSGDVWSINYSISLEAYQVDQKKISKSPFIKRPESNPTSQKTPKDYISEGYLLTGGLHPESLPTSLIIESPDKYIEIPTNVSIDFTVTPQVSIAGIINK